MCVPIVETAQCSDYQSVIGGRLLEIQRPPCLQSTLCVRALRSLWRQPQQPQSAVAVMRKIGVNAYPSVRATIQPGKFVPDLRNAPVDAEPAGTFEGGVQHVDVNILSNLATRVTKLAGRQRRRCNGDLRSSTDRKRRRQHRVGAT